MGPITIIQYAITGFLAIITIAIALLIAALPIKIAINIIKDSNSENHDYESKDTTKNK